MYARTLGVVCLGVLMAGFGPGCASVKVGSTDPSHVEVSGLAHGYLAVDLPRPYDGTILELGLLREAPASGEFEIVSFDLWPIGGVGVGVIGARFELVVVQAALGILGYSPDPPARRTTPERTSEPPEKEPDAEPEPEVADPPPVAPGETV